MAVAAAALLLSLPYLCGIVVSDEGYLVHIADRIASGEVLYRDISTGVTPASFYLHAILFRLFGRSLLAGRLLMIALFTASTCGVYGLARRVSDRGVASAAALSFAALTVSFWRIPNYSSEAIAVCLVGLGAILRHLRGGGRGSLALAGVAIGAAFLFKQNYGVFLAGGVTASLLAAGGPARRRLRTVAAAAGWALAPVLATLAFFAAHGALDDLYRDTVLIPMGYTSTLYARYLPPLWGAVDPEFESVLWQYLPFQDLTSEFSRFMGTHLGLRVALARVFFYSPAVLLAAAAGLWLRRARRSRDAAGGPERGAGMLLLATSGLLLLGVFPRADAAHLVMVLAPVFPLAAWMLGPAPPAVPRRLFVGAAGLLLLLSLASQAAVIADREPHRWRTTRLDLPRAGVWLRATEAEHIGRMVTTLQERVREGEPIFAAPALPMYYFLADRPNPTRHPVILPGGLDEEGVVDALEAGGVRLAVVTDHALERYTFDQVAPEVWAYLRAEFGPDEEAGWGVHPFPPYLLRRGAEEPPGPKLLVRMGEGGPSVLPDPPETEAAALWRLGSPEPEDLPPYRVQSGAPWVDPQPDRLRRGSVQLRPTLEMIAPWGWRKVMAAWEVPVQPGVRFEVDLALAPVRWANPGLIPPGQGAMVEAWVGEPDRLPRRAWIAWLDPRRRPADRGWRTLALDLASFVAAGRARVTLVAGPSPTFDGTDATVAFAGLRLTRSGGEGALQGPRPRGVPVGDAAAARMLGFEPGDLDMFRAAVRAYPDLPRSHAALGDVAAAAGARAEALLAYARAVAMQPDEPRYRLRYSRALQEAGRHDEALAELGAAVELEAGEPNHHAAMAALLTRLGRREEARAAVRRALRLDREHGWALSLLAALERGAGDPDAAVSAARRAVEAEPGRGRGHLELIDALRAAGRDEEARRALRRAVALGLDPGLRAVIARRSLALGDAAGALEQARRAAGEGPRSALAWTVLGEAAAASGRDEESAAAFARAVEIEPGRFNALVGLALALHDAGDRGGALERLGRAAALAGDDAPRHRRLARAYARIGRPDEATAAWERVLVLSPGGRLGEEARRHLAARPSP